MEHVLVIFYLKRLIFLGVLLVAQTCMGGKNLVFGTVGWAEDEEERTQACVFTLK